MRPNSFKREIIKNIVETDGGSVAETTHIIEHCLKYVRKHIEKGEFSTIRLPYFGKFSVNPKRLQNLNNEVLHRRKPQSKSRSGNKGHKGV